MSKFQDLMTKYAKMLIEDKFIYINDDGLIDSTETHATKKIVIG